MRRLLVRNPFVSISLLGLGLMAAAWVLGFEYDSPHAGKLIFWLGTALGVVFWVVHEMLGHPAHPLVVVPLGLALCACLDWIWRVCVLHKL